MMVKMGIIGYGYWGPNIVRNFLSQEKAQIISICDIDEEALNKAKKHYPKLTTISDPDEVLSSPEIDAIAIVTPVYTHYDLAKKALENGKHIFVEKPFTSSVAEAEELIELADRRRLKIMVDHTFLFTGAVRKIKALVEDGVLGNLYYYDSTRVNLGLFQHDINVIWDLAPHDLSIMDYLIQEKPNGITATGTEHFGRGLEDVAYITVYFANNIIAHFNVNWLSPVKIRMTLIGGEKKMLVWNDLESDEKLKVYDRGVDIEDKEGIYELLVSYRAGDIWTPMVDTTEALKLEAEYFLDCIEYNDTPINDGYAGLNVVKILEASDLSLKNSGKLVKL
jgi:predicted dehydrogenase